MPAAEASFSASIWSIMRGMTEGPLWQCMSTAPTRSASIRSSMSVPSAAGAPLAAIPLPPLSSQARRSYGRVMGSERRISALFAERKIPSDGTPKGGGRVAYGHINEPFGAFRQAKCSVASSQEDREVGYDNHVG